MFHSIKTPLPLVFEMIYRISVNKKGISAISLSREYDISKLKICLAMELIERENTDKAVIGRVMQFQ